MFGVRFRTACVLFHHYTISDSLLYQYCTIPCCGHFCFHNHHHDCRFCYYHQYDCLFVLLPLLSLVVTPRPITNTITITSTCDDCHYYDYYCYYFYCYYYYYYSCCLHGYDKLHLPLPLLCVWFRACGLPPPPKLGNDPFWARVGSEKIYTELLNKSKYGVLTFSLWSNGVFCCNLMSNAVT